MNLSTNRKKSRGAIRKGYLLFLGLMVMLAIVLSGGRQFKVDNQRQQDNLQEQDVLAVLKKFQAGYNERDVSKADEYVRDLFDAEDVLIIGTGASAPGDGEWCEGIEAVKQIIKSDWKHWDDLKMETEKARIRINGKTAWVAFGGTSKSRQTTKSGYASGMEAIRYWQNQNKYQENPREFFLWLSYYTSRMLLDYELVDGEGFIYPIRITAVLSNKNGKWLFKHVNFAYPTGYHKTRIVKDYPK